MYFNVLPYDKILQLATFSQKVPTCHIKSVQLFYNKNTSACTTTQVFINRPIYDYLKSNIYVYTCDFILNTLIVTYFYI